MEGRLRCTSSRKPVLCLVGLCKSVKTSDAEPHDRVQDNLLELADANDCPRDDIGLVMEREVLQGPRYLLVETRLGHVRQGQYRIQRFFTYGFPGLFYDRVHCLRPLCSMNLARSMYPSLPHYEIYVRSGTGLVGAPEWGCQLLPGMHR